MLHSNRSRSPHEDGIKPITVQPDPVPVKP
jgi:hypothetical protein